MSIQIGDYVFVPGEDRAVKVANLNSGFAAVARNGQCWLVPVSKCVKVVDVASAHRYAVTKVTVTFLHGKRGCEFCARWNKLTGDWLHTYNNWRNAYVSDLAQVKRIINRIRAADKNASIIWA